MMVAPAIMTDSLPDIAVHHINRSIACLPIPIAFR